MNISSQGLQKIIQREGIILHAYQDSVGVWTIGTGHTSAAGSPAVHAGMVITKEQNDEILQRDLEPIQSQCAEYVKVPITQNQYDAIISIVYNVGPKFWHSTCIQRLNAGDVKGAADAIMQWSKPPEIIGRRRTEQKQFLTPDVSEEDTSPSMPDVTDVETKVTSVSNIATSVRKFAKDNVTTNIPVAAGGLSAMFTHNWPYILAGTLVLAGLIWLGIYIYHNRKGII